MRNKAIFFMVGTILILHCSRLVIAQEVSQVNQAKEQEAVIASQAWLAQVDQGQYEDSWTNASAYFKSMISKDLWSGQVAAVRKALGNIISRTFGKKQYLAALPGAPDGEYYVLIFNTVFANKAAAVETVTMVKESEGQWRAAGYFIK